MDQDLAYRCQMLPDYVRKSRTLSVQALLNAGWERQRVEMGIDSALAWANSYVLSDKQEKYRKSRHQRNLKNDDALDLMFTSMGHDPADIPSRNGFHRKGQG